MTIAAEDEIVLKFLHTADWHLGRQFKSFGAENERKLGHARLGAVERLLLAAERWEVQAVLCAGDLFDTPNPSSDWWESLTNAFQRHKWQGRPVILLPGNHDPLLADSIWRNEAFRRRLPNFVHIVDRVPFELELSKEAVLYAVPCQSKAGQNDPTESIPERAPNDERIRIGMVHGSTFDAKDCQTNFPIHRDAVVRRGLDYLAIGDTHGFRYVPPDRKHPPTIYPGAPEPTAFDEIDAGSVAVVFVNRQRRALIQLDKVAHWVWEAVRIDTLEALRQLARRTDLANRVLRVCVDLRLPVHECQEAERLLQDLEGTEARAGRAGVFELDRERLESDTTNFDEYCSTLPAVLQATVTELKKAVEDPEQRIVAERALYHLYRLISPKAS
jgi:DNA repair exonuclease SbcCD nuclease subunit